MTSEARGKELQFWPQKLTRGREGGQYHDPKTPFLDPYLKTNLASTNKYVWIHSAKNVPI